MKFEVITVKINRWIFSSNQFCFILFPLMKHRNCLLKKRLSKGPNKIVLAPTDFEFPIDSRRVSSTSLISLV